MLPQTPLRDGATRTRNFVVGELLMDQSQENKIIKYSFIFNVNDFVPGPVTKTFLSLCEKARGSSERNYRPLKSYLSHTALHTGCPTRLP